MAARGRRPAGICWVLETIISVVAIALILPLSLII
ncbi:hypothetical protein ABH930_006770 [Kitasatospora sp. GAS204A]|nr:hypothetical protein [Kitasatospora sp. GAS204B]